MKRGSLLSHLRQHGCYLKREGRSHSLWTNPGTGATEAIPRHTEISSQLARKICRGLKRVTTPHNAERRGNADRTFSRHCLIDVLAYWSPAESVEAAECA